MSKIEDSKPKSAFEKRTSTTMDTLGLTQESVAKFLLPSGQRPLRENQKVRDLADAIRDDGGVIPGIITIGKLDDDIYIIDGQHRLHAFKLSECKEGYVDVRILHAKNMQEINNEFVELNSRLVTMRPDDFLRGLEDSTPSLQYIRKQCPFVGYDMIRRGPNSPILSASSVLRWWAASARESPTTISETAITISQNMPMDDAEQLAKFLKMAYEAYGHDISGRSLWSGLNMTLTMWLYRRTILMPISKQSRMTKLNYEQFMKGLMSLAASAKYCEWLKGRLMSERDRPAALARIKTLFARRLHQDYGIKVSLPQPEWAYTGSLGKSGEIL